MLGSWNVQYQLHLQRGWRERNVVQIQGASLGMGAVSSCLLSWEGRQRLEQLLISGSPTPTAKNQTIFVPAFALERNRGMVSHYYSPFFLMPLLYSTIHAFNSLRAMRLSRSSRSTSTVAGCGMENVQDSGQASQPLKAHYDLDPAFCCALCLPE